MVLPANAPIFMLVKSVEPCPCLNDNPAPYKQLYSTTIRVLSTISRGKAHGRGAGGKGQLGSRGLGDYSARSIGRATELTMTFKLNLNHCLDTLSPHHSGAAGSVQQGRRRYPSATYELGKGRRLPTRPPQRKTLLIPCSSTYPVTSGKALF